MDDRVGLIEAKLRDAFSPAHVTVEDESHRHRGHAGAAGGGGHFRVTLVSERFEGMPRIKRHRSVYDALAGLMDSEIHALALHAFTPEEWANEEPARA